MILSPRPLVQTLDMAVWNPILLGITTVDCTMRYRKCHCIVVKVMCVSKPWAQMGDSSVNGGLGDSSELEAVYTRMLSLFSQPDTPLRLLELLHKIAGIGTRRPIGSQETYRYGSKGYLSPAVWSPPIIACRVCWGIMAYNGE